METLIGLFQFVREFPGAAATLSGMFIGAVYGTFLMRREVRKLFEFYLGDYKIMKKDVETLKATSQDHEKRLKVLEAK